jgi:PIN domain nuclease of toxin-antitoxin system
MKLLLDTHIVLWSAAGSEKLPKKIGAALNDSQNQLFYSPASVWEVLVLVDKGRMSKVSNKERFVEKLFEGLTEAPMNTHVAIASRTIEFPHQDPGDRFIGATAFVYGLTLVTTDEKLLKTPGLNVFD